MPDRNKLIATTMAGTLVALSCLLAPSLALAQDDCCTDHLACQDGRWCTGIEYCNCWGVCISGTRPNCEDGNPCTADNCVDDVIEAAGMGYGMGHCEQVDICGGCTVPADCDDGNMCTTDQCIGGSCVNAWITGCCITNADCDDADICTSDLCAGNVCSNTPIANCCHNDGDCNDLDPCTSDVCSSTNTCSNTALAGCCVTDAECDDGDNCTEESCDLVDNVCQTTWTGVAGTSCCNTNADCDDTLDCNGWETCNTTVVARGQCEDAPDVTCDDGYDCTTDACNEATAWCATPPDFCVCSHAMPATVPYDTCASSGAMTQSGSGAFMQWAASGDTHCSANDYAPTCAGSGRDNVHGLSVPTDGATNHQLYEYSFMVEALDMDPTVSIWPSGTCGGTSSWGCNATSLGACWTGTGHAAADGNDACFDAYAWSNAKAVLPEGSYSVLVDSANAQGGNYDLYATRSPFNNTQCGMEVEVQMGGKWYGNTYASATYGCAFCTSSAVSGSGGACSGYSCNATYAQAEFELDHTGTPWQRPMGYIVTGDGVGAFDPAMSMFKHSCYSNLSTNLAQVYAVACSNDMDASLAPRIVTGVVPSLYTAELRLHGYDPGVTGQYELTVEYDTDGDGLADDDDSWPASRWGATANVGGGQEDGPIPIDAVPFTDTRTSWGYPADDLEDCRVWLLVCFEWVGRNGEEVYYKLNVGGTVDVRLSPAARGDVWTHANVPDGWDPVLWYSPDCSSWSYEDAGGVNDYEEATGVNGDGCIAVDGYVGGDGGYYLLEVTR